MNRTRVAGTRLVARVPRRRHGAVAALLRGPGRTATVAASTPLDLLVLGGRSFHALVEQFPQVATRLRAAAEERAA